ncbi:MAG: ABC transporter substrate-binding protein, partial [Acidobacteriota bacterium]
LLTDTIPEELRAVAAARLSHRVLRREVTSLATNYLLVQKRIAPFNDLRVRQALGLSIDRIALQGAWEKGLAIPATTLLPPDLLGYEQRDKTHRPRHDESKSLLKQAGYPKGFETEIAVRRASSLYRAALLVELKRQLEAIDVVLNVNSIPDDEYAAVVAEGDSPLLLQGWVADYPDPDAFFHSLFMSGSGRARAFLASPSLDALILDARAEVHQDERRRLYMRAEEYLRQEAIFIPLSHDREVVYFHPNLRGLSLRLMAPHVEIDRLWVAE